MGTSVVVANAGTAKLAVIEKMKQIIMDEGFI